MRVEGGHFFIAELPCGDEAIFRRDGDRAWWLPDDRALRLLPVIEADPWLPDQAADLRDCMDRLDLLPRIAA